MKKFILFFMFILGIIVPSYAQHQMHSECRDPACLGLLGSCSVSFVNISEVTVYVPRPSATVLGINSPIPVSDWGIEGNKIKIVFRNSVTDNGIALLDIVVDKRIIYMNHEMQGYYHIELYITKG